MVSAYLRLTRQTLVLCLLMPIIVSICSRVMEHREVSTTFLAGMSVLTLAAGVGCLVVYFLLRRLEPGIQELSADTGGFLDKLPDRLVPLAIAASAAGSLALELAMIRWQGTIWEIFAYHKNFSLLSCFAGLGLGYALAKRNHILAVMALPLLALQMLTLVLLRHGVGKWILNLKSLKVAPLREQINMGFSRPDSLPQLIAVYSFLGMAMLLTALAFVPMGQICGRLLERTAQLRAYGWNLAGSLAGTLLMLLLSFLWTPPVLWFLPCMAVFVILQAHNRRIMGVGLLASSAIIVVLAWPVSVLNEQIYSPYQRLERGAGDRGLTMIRVAGLYYQRIHDLSRSTVAAVDGLRPLADYYEMPYRLHPQAHRVAVVGAGTGNDVAAALRCGATHVDAIEIDPAIMRIGASYHPEQPYADKRVTCVVNDARSFLRNTTNRYDLIVYGLLDSHTLLSHASSVRLDSYVYTVEGIRDAKSRLVDDGVLSLSFCVCAPELGRKIYLMLEKAFDGRPPVCVRTGYDGSVIFAQSKNGNLTVDPELLRQTGFEDYSARYADSKLLADIPTDDWPFFYMPRRIYPLSYIGMAGLVLLISVLLFWNFIGERPRFSHAAYFFMGAGFMLVETKAITELGLTFGNTWQVIGIVISAILVMAYLANFAVMKIGLRRLIPPFVLLILSLAVGLIVAKSGALPATPVGKLTAVVVLTIPVFFSGIAFSSLLAGTGDISGALALNLLGAMFGGLLEYNSMFFGFQFLYWIAMGMYLAAMVSTLIVRRAA